MAILTPGSIIIPRKPFVDRPGIFNIFNELSFSLSTPSNQQVQDTQCFLQLQLLRDYFFVFINRQLLAT